MASADGEFDTFLKVSLDDVQRVAQKYFAPEGRVVMRIMPRGGARSDGQSRRDLGRVRRPDRVVAAPALTDASSRCASWRSLSERWRQAQSRVEWPRENPPRPLPARPVTFPPYEIRKLANGLQVVLVSQNEQPVVSVRMIVRAGAAHDPKGKHGLAMLTATLLDQGAGEPERRADRRDDRLHRRHARHRRRHRPQLRQRHRDEGQLRRRRSI